MIEIQDEDIPLDPAVFTLKEFMEGVHERLFWHDRGDAVIERYVGSPETLHDRAWLWRDGTVQSGVAHLFFVREADERTLILWWPAKERMN